jgi:protein-L-isoaspartate(D-aspartate) O-methyltransferase
LQHAQIKPSDVVLDIGCATGYSSAVAARLAATVIALESDSQLVRRAEQTLAKLQADNVVVVEGALGSGYARQAPYDVILMQGAVPEIPAAIAAQLAEGGRLCAVVSRPGHAGQAVLALKTGGVVSRRDIFDAATPPLPGFDFEPGFRF